jgi:hypothetical protein
MVVCRRIASNAQRSSEASIEYVRKAKAHAQTLVTLRLGTPSTCVDITVDDVSVSTLFLLGVA